MNYEKVNARIMGRKIECNYLYGTSNGAYILEWDGPIGGIAEISEELYRTELPWPVEELEFNILRRCYYVQRLDHGFYAWNRLMVDVDKFANWYKTIQMRCILTLSVWNLAYVPPGVCPDMCHVGKKPEPYIPRRVAKTFDGSVTTKPERITMGVILKAARLLGYED